MQIKDNEEDKDDEGRSWRLRTLRMLRQRRVEKLLFYEAILRNFRRQKARTAILFFSFSHLCQNRHPDIRLTATNLNAQCHH